MSLIAEQSAKLIIQLVNDYEQLAAELLEINMEEILDKRPDLKALILMNLTDMKTKNNGAFVFVDSMRAIKEGTDLL